MSVAIAQTNLDNHEVLKENMQGNKQSNSEGTIVSFDLYLSQPSQDDVNSNQEVSRNIIPGPSYAQEKVILSELANIPAQTELYVQK